MTRLPTLISPAQLDELFAGARPPVVLDVRWTLPRPDGREDFMLGHIPGALYVSLDDELAAPAHDDPTAGRHPLPDPQGFQATVRAWGVDEDSTVVVYDDNQSLGAARAWWLLRWAGKTDVHVLDGGLGAWQRAGLPLAGGPFVRPRPGTFTVTGGHRPVIDAAGAADLGARGTLIDSRAPERYRGEVEPMDPRAGHIPGALNRPTTDNIDPATGRFKDPQTLRAEFTRITGADALAGAASAAAPAASPQEPAGELGVYCGSGVTACHNLLALDTLGVTAALYPASWSGWSADPQAPAATGD
jgi:thiosulfate/3-mercaptopyruvate sulfurtransferase